MEGEAEDAGSDKDIEMSNTVPYRCKADARSDLSTKTALLVVQVGEGGEVSRMVQQQLDSWTEVKAYNNIKQDRIKLLSFVAGE